MPLKACMPLDATSPCGGLSDVRGAHPGTPTSDVAHRGNPMRPVIGTMARRGALSEATNPCQVSVPALGPHCDLSWYTSGLLWVFQEMLVVPSWYYHHRRVSTCYSSGATS